MNKIKMGSWLTSSSSKKDDINNILRRMTAYDLYLISIKKDFNNPNIKFNSHFTYCISTDHNTLFNELNQNVSESKLIKTKATDGTGIYYINGFRLLTENELNELNLPPILDHKYFNYLYNDEIYSIYRSENKKTMFINNNGKELYIDSEFDALTGGFYKLQIKNFNRLNKLKNE